MPKSEYGYGNPHGDSKADRRKDVEKAADNKPKACPTCGRKYGGSNTGGATVGGGV